MIPHKSLIRERLWSTKRSSAVVHCAKTYNRAMLKRAFILNQSAGDDCNIV